MSKTDLSKTLAGKVALVTGGSRGIGAAIAKALADDGADVAISYAASADKAKQVVKELEAKGVRAAAFKADQADAAAVEALVRAVAKQFGRLDILVNNAGVFAVGQVHETNWQRRRFRPAGRDQCRRRRRGRARGGGSSQRRRPHHQYRIDFGDVTPWPGLADYSATKAAVGALTRGLGARSRAQGHHRQQRAARPDRYRHEPGRQRFRAGAEGEHGARALRQARGGRGGGRVPRQPRCGFHHRCHAKSMAVTA